MSFLATASPDLLPEILDLTYPLWGEGLSREGYERYNAAQARTPWGRAHLRRLVLMDGGRLASTAKRYDLRARLDGRETRVLGIGAVFTPEPLRGNGHATDLLRRMLAQAEGEGFGAALLFSEIGPRYYARLGFRPLPVNQVAIAVTPAAGPPAIPMRRGEPRDLAAIGEMNAAQSAGCRFALDRRADYIEFALAKKRLLAACGPPGRWRVQFLVVEEGERAAAYLVLLEVGGSWMLTEFGDRDPSGARVGAMLQSLLVDPPRRPVRIRAWLPPSFLPPQVRVTAREVAPLTMMMRVLGRDPASSPPLGLDDLAYWHADAF